MGKKRSILSALEQSTEIDGFTSALGMESNTQRQGCTVFGRLTSEKESRLILVVIQSVTEKKVRQTGWSATSTSKR